MNGGLHLPVGKVTENQVVPRCTLVESLLGTEQLAVGGLLHGPMMKA